MRHRHNQLSYHPTRRHSQHVRLNSMYIAYEGGVPGLKPGTLVATGYAISVVADGHHPTPDELAAALDGLVS